MSEFPDRGHGPCSDCQDDREGVGTMPSKVWEWVVFIAAALYLIILVVDLVDGARVG